MVYLPAHDAATEPAQMAALIRAAPLAMVVTTDGTELTANHLPLLLETGPDRLIGHVARGNDLWRDGQHEGESLAVFSGADHYLSPSWYPSKAEHHQVVPTWNYLVAHVYGELVVHDDPRWVRGAVAKLTHAMEASRDEPWRMADAPRDYLQQRLGDIVGIELRISRIVGKFKVSAARTAADRQGAADGIEREPDSDAAAPLITAMRDVPHEAR